jgi:CheY-like chemotaxis protein
VKKAILVVDDDRHSREGLREVLTYGEHEVETAADSWQAIKKIREHPFEVAIIDLDLPPVYGVALTGWDLVLILRAYQPSIEILVVSAESDAALRIQAAGLRVSEVLEKPISPNYVKAILRRLAS